VAESLYLTVHRSAAVVLKLCFAAALAGISVFNTAKLHAERL